MEKVLPYKWPLALDILKIQYDAHSSRLLLAAQTQLVNNVGKNMEVHLFGVIGYFTSDPKNLEAILSTQFEGTKLADIVIDH